MKARCPACKTDQRVTVLTGRLVTHRGIDNKGVAVAWCAASGYTPEEFPRMFPDFPSKAKKASA